MKKKVLSFHEAYPGSISGYPKESVSAIFFVPKPVHNIILYDGTMKRTKSRRGL